MTEYEPLQFPQDKKTPKASPEDIKQGQEELSQLLDEEQGHLERLNQLIRNAVTRAKQEPDDVPGEEKK